MEEYVDKRFYSREEDILLKPSKNTISSHRPSYSEVLYRILRISKQECREVCMQDIKEYEDKDPERPRLRDQTIYNALTELVKMRLILRVSQGNYIVTPQGISFGEKLPMGGEGPVECFGFWVQQMVLSDENIVRQYHSVDLQFQAKGVHRAIEEGTAKGWEVNHEAGSLIWRLVWEGRRVTVQVQGNDTVNIQISCGRPELVLTTDSVGFAYLYDFLGGLRKQFEALIACVPESPDWLIVQIHFGLDCKKEWALEDGLCVTLKDVGEILRIYDKPGVIRFEIAKTGRESLKDFSKRELDFKSIVVDKLNDLQVRVSKLDEMVSGYEKRLAQPLEVSEEMTAKPILIMADQLGSLVNSVTRLAKTIEATQA